MKKKICLMSACYNIHLILLGFVFKREKRVKILQKRVQNVHDGGRDIVRQLKANVINLQV